MLKKISVLIALAVANLASGSALADCVIGDSTESDFPESLVLANSSGSIQSAWYDDATNRYAHGVLGDAIEPSTLRVSNGNGCTFSVELDQAHVFEDLTPRLADIDGVTGVEIVTVRSHQNFGAQIAIYQLVDDGLELMASTPYIGTRHRWLAPVGIADLDNDGDVDIAYVDRPHLAKILRVWSYRDGELHEVASKAGFSNHRIGEAFISGGLKHCNQRITMVTAGASWRRIMETTLENNQLVSQDVGAFQGTESLAKALRCE